MKVSFWQMRNGYMSHTKGLSQEQVNDLHKLQVGDKLVLYNEEVNDPKSDVSLVLRTIKKGSDRAE